MYPKPPSSSSQNFRNWSSFFSSSSLTSNPIKTSYWLCVQKLSSISSLFFSCTTIVLSYWSQYFKSFLCLLPQTIYSQTLTMLFWEHKLEHHISLLKTHFGYPLQKGKKKKKKCLIMGHESFLATAYFWLHVSSDYIIYLAWDTALLSLVKLIVAFDLVISLAWKLFLLLLSSFRSQLKYHSF